MIQLYDKLDSNRAKVVMEHLELKSEIKKFEF